MDLLKVKAYKLESLEPYKAKIKNQNLKNSNLLAHNIWYMVSIPKQVDNNYVIKITYLKSYFVH